MTRKYTLLRISAIGFSQEKTIYLAHQNGNWGPENQNSDYHEHALRNALTKGTPHSQNELRHFELYTNCLREGEEFKFFTFVENEKEARTIWQARMRRGVHVGMTFDYDEKEKTFWFLTPIFPVTRFGEWDQNNVLYFSDTGR